MSKSISELRNLGPACEADLNAIGIHTLDDIKAHGIEGTFLRLVQSRKENGKSTNGFNALYLYALYGAVHDLNWKDIPEEKKQEFKRFTAQIRKGLFG